MSRLKAWERRSEWPLMAAAFVFLAAYAWPILQADMSDTGRRAAEVLTWVAWAAFAADYLVRLRLAERRRDFVRANLIDLAVIALPLFRPLRLLRLVTLLAILNRGAAALRGKVAVYVGGATGLIVTLAALAVLDAERSSPEATITSFGDAMWWAATTVTTVGYGDSYPTTAGGRSVAVGLMLAGIALLGIVTASLASWLIDKVRAVEEEAQAVTRQDLAALSAQIEALQALVVTHMGAAAPGVDGPPRRQAP